MFIVKHDQFADSFCTSEICARAQIQRLNRHKKPSKTPEVTPFTLAIWQDCSILQVQASYPLGTVSPARFQYYYYWESHVVKPLRTYPFFLLDSVAFFVPPIFYWPLLAQLNLAISNYTVENVTTPRGFEVSSTVSLKANATNFCMPVTLATLLRQRLLENKDLFKALEGQFTESVPALVITQEVQ